LNLNLIVLLRTWRFYQTCAHADPAADPHEAHLLVDPVEVEKNLTLLLG
jgi:hypothetical protein